MMESEVSFESALQKLKSMFDCSTEDGHPAKGTWCGNCREICDADGTNWCDRNRYLDDVLAVEEAHKREIEEIREKWMHQAAVIADGKHKLIDRLKRELAAKDAEIASLRTLVKELADALNDATAIACKGEYCNKHSFCQDCQATKNRELVAKAREVCNG